jgi:UDP-glucose 4-epimerase
MFCAGIAHRKAADSLHYSINSGLAVDAAKKAKIEGAKQFLYLSSAAAVNPVNAYGRSKLSAETSLKALENESFTVTIVRPPMVYGSGCKGNFTRLVKLSRLLPVFPDIRNKRCMIYIDNLCHFMADIIIRRVSGTFFPQNTDPVCTTELVRLIAGCLDKKIWFTKLFNPIIAVFSGISAVDKMFGDFVYNGEGLVPIDFIGFEESVKMSLMCIK